MVSYILLILVCTAMAAAIEFAYFITQFLKNFKQPFFMKKIFMLLLICCNNLLYAQQPRIDGQGFLNGATSTYIGLPQPALSNISITPTTMPRTTAQWHFAG